jgi:hypothetical protein
VLRVRWGEWAEAGGVGSRLRAELSEVEIGSSAVTDVHGLPETLLRVVPVEYDSVQDDRNTLENDFNEAAN